MPARFVNIDRDTPLLLPPNLRQWVPEDHLVHFILDAVDSLPLTGLRVNERGTGDLQLPPRETPAPKDQYNFTDPDSRIMKSDNGRQFEQAYSAQASVETESRLIVSVRVAPSQIPTTATSKPTCRDALFSRGN